MKVMFDVLKFKHEDNGMTSFCRCSSVTVVNFEQKKDNFQSINRIFLIISFNRYLPSGKLLF